MNTESLALIDKLADKLGTTAEAIMQIILAQAQVVIIHQGLWLGICVLILMAMAYGLYKMHKFQAGDGDTDIFMVIYAIASIIALFFILSMYESVNIIITAYYNPEYWALADILSKLN